MKIESELKRIYASLPSIECKGKCQACCSVITLTQLEYERILEAGGTLGPVTEYELDDRGIVPGSKVALTQALTCVALKEGRCSVYENRPLICRVWGLTKSLRCPYGCTPSRWLSDREAQKLFKRVAALSAKHERKT